MLYLLNKDVRTVRWNGEPLHEATLAIVKETMNGDFTLNVKYPISDSGIYQLIKEDMLIKAPTPVLGAQLFRIKKPVEHNDHLEITAYHISDDVMQRSITPMSVTSQSCGMALSRMVQNTKTALGDFSFNSDIQDRRTFNTTETETLYSVLLDGKHSIVGTWEGELVRDNFAMTIKKSRGENRGVVITTHKNLKDYQRTRNSQNVVTRIHAKSTFKPEGSEKETTLRVTVDSPLINSYPYINEKEYENNNAKTVEELQKWAQAKFSNEGIDKVSDAIKIEAYELDGQVVHMGDTVNLKSRKHNVDAFKKAIAYEFDALKEEYISLTFDDKAGTGGSRASGGLSSAADAILGITESAQEVALEKALQNADLDFDHKAGLLRQEISDGLELAKARAEEVKRELSDTIDQRFNSFNNGPLQEAKRRAEEALRNAGASSLLAQEAKRIGEQATADITKLKNEVVGGYVRKNTYQEGIRGIERRIEEVKASANGQVATQIAQYKQTVDGQFASITSQVAGKANLLDFQRVQETSKLYERIIGRSESDIADKVARMALTNQLFQVEVAKNASNGQNLLKGTKGFSGDWKNMVHGWKKHADKYQGCDVLFKNNSWNGVGQEIDAKIGEIYTFSLWMKSDWKSDTVNFYVNKNGSVDKGWGVPSETSVAITNEWKRYSFTFKITADGFIFPRVERSNQSANLYVAGFKLEKGSYATPYTEAPEDTDEAIRTVQNQLTGSWAVQNLTSAGSIVSQINATNNQILIEAEKIRLKGNTLLDELTAIDGYFKRLFVGEGNFAKLNAEIIGSRTITADKLIMDQAMARMFVSSDIFTDTLAAKEAFINKLRSVVVSATLLEGYKGVIGGFQLGTHEKDPSVYWLTGRDQFSVGMSNGYGKWSQTALWVNWGSDWNAPGSLAWFVKRSGEMYCYNRAYFWNTPTVNGNLRVTGEIYYNNENSGKSGYWIYSPQYKQIFSENGYMYFIWSGGGSSWIPMNKEISDRRYKSNIEASTVSGLDVIENLKTYSYRKEYDGKIEFISCGIMAQEVQKYVPEAFYKNPDGAYSYRTFELVPYLIKAIQELNQKLEKLEKTA
ncbi:phage tail spike protein [Streptococcus halitosis]|uniref:phage tail spike protein n=1 Tax=Streptococcus halitosis TaxID=2172545 RepID=UPI0022E16842|nr:phage tail spike protein [Streptococcus halitosis]